MASAEWVAELYRLRLELACAQSNLHKANMCRVRYYEQTKRLEALEP